MAMKEAINPPPAFTPSHFVHTSYGYHIPNYAHFLVPPMVHPTMGERIINYKHLMNDPKTAQVWQAASSKDFGEMVQGNLKIGQKGTNSVFVMTWDEIDAAVSAGHKWTMLG
jgi:hypothetical protein